VRILMYDYEYPPLGGGGGISHHAIAAELAVRHQVTVVTSGFAGLPRQEVVDSVEVCRVPVLGRTKRAVASLPSMLSYPPSTWLHGRFLKDRSFDIVNSHFAVPTGPGSLVAAWRMGIRHVQTIHGGDIYDPSKKLSPHRHAPTRWVVRQVLRRSDAVVAQSQDTRTNARRFYGEDLRIEIIPLSVKVPERLPSATRSDLGLPTDAFLGITVGRLLTRKRVDRLLRCLAEPPCSSVHLVIVGEGPERPDLERLTGELGLEDRVRFAGRVKEETKWQMLRAADVYLSLTAHEGYGLAFLEAMAMGLPVVAPDCGGHMDFLQDGRTGFIVPSDDLGLMVEAVARFARDPDLARVMGAENAGRFRRNHRIETIAARYEELFERVLEDPRTSRKDPLGVPPGA